MWSRSLYYASKTKKSSEYILSIVCQSGSTTTLDGGSFVQSFDILDDFQVENIQLCAFESHESETSSSLLLGHPGRIGWLTL